MGRRVGGATESRTEEGPDATNGAVGRRGPGRGVPARARAAPRRRACRRRHPRRAARPGGAARAGRALRRGATAKFGARTKQRCVASLGASDAVWRASGSSYTAPFERLLGAGAGLVGLGVYAGAARCRADALDGEVPSGAAAACCVFGGAGAAITLLYGVSDGIHDEQKARLALLKNSPGEARGPRPIRAGA